VALSWAGTAGLRLSVNAGYHQRADTQLLNLMVSDELALRLGAGYRLAGPPLELALGLSAATAADGPIGESEQNHMEGHLGATYNISEVLQGIAAAGIGINQGFGTPDWRIVLAVRFGHHGVPDRDGDGVADNTDSCPEQPEDKDDFEDDDGCPDPDNDKDGIADVDDGAPNEPEDMDQYADTDGVPDPDNDGDGILDAADQCPVEAETQNSYEDSDGCPDTVPDSDGDGLADNADQCINEAEDLDSFSDEDGCPDPDNDEDGVVDTSDRCVNTAGPVENHGCPDTDRDGDTVVDRLDNCPDEPGSVDNSGCKKQQLVKISTGKLEILEKVYFQTNRAVLRSRSFGVLRNVAAVLQSHPEINQVQVEGHTDDKGNDEKNLTLSQKRAEAVVEFLVEQGIAPERLVPLGFGETQPIDTNDTAAGRQKNRRVEFNILDATQTVIDTRTKE
jgi:outer membrane protein OmpA-like peptidoglycan-associated protein